MLSPGSQYLEIEALKARRSCPLKPRGQGSYCLERTSGGSRPNKRLWHRPSEKRSRKHIENKKSMNRSKLKQREHAW